MNNTLGFNKGLAIGFGLALVMTILFGVFSFPVQSAGIENQSKAFKNRLMEILVHIQGGNKYSINKKKSFSYTR
jgi:hypothetical protein